MPWCAGGDRAGSVFKRSLKNVYWSTTFLVPATVFYTAWGWIRNEIGDRVLEANLAIWAVYVLAAGVPVLLLLRIWLTGASRYVGEPDGPAFGPREPACDPCGYLIVGLPLDANCPECGTPVRESLPGGRRRPGDWHRHELRPRGFTELLRMQWHVLRGSDLFARLPVHEGFAAARHFWWGTYLLMVLVGLAAARLGLTMIGPYADTYLFTPLALLALAAPLILQSATMFIACLWAQYRYDIRDYRSSAIVCYYASPLLWPVMILPVAATATIFAFPAQWWRNLGQDVIGVDLLMLAGLAIPIVVAAPLLFWWSRLSAALRAVRYANV